MPLDDSPNHIQLSGSKAVITNKPKGLKPKFAGSVLAFHVNVRWLIAVKAREKEPIRPGDPPDSRHLEVSPPRTTLQIILHGVKKKLPTSFLPCYLQVISTL